MPKQARGLSAAFCSTVKEPGRYSDKNGLILVVSATGSKRWIQRLVIRGKRTDMGLGSADFLTLAQAREVAKTNRGIAREGGDPLADRRREQEIPTFATASDSFLKMKRTEFRNAKHIQQWENTLSTYADPVLGRLRVSEITVHDVKRVLDPIWRQKNETAARLRGRIEAVLSFATVHGWRSGPNPAAWSGNLDMLLPKPAKVKQVTHHPALDVDDIPDWYHQLVRRNGIAPRALEFAALTWARSGEVRGATWEEIDLDRRTWSIPKARMKAGEPHVIPLSEPAVRLLRSLPRQTHSPLIFAAPRGGMLSDMSLSAVMRRMHTSRVEHDLAINGRFPPEVQLTEQQAGWRDPQSGRPAVPHGLRSTARVWAGRTGHPRELAEHALAHTVGSKVELAYARDTMVERRRPMMEQWGEHICSASESVSRAQTGMRAV